ncbi:hypothetical protein E3N88_36897 [Mikania micrantha]|uniref:Uncharacterized protein n=1 Tax=Mikania micrantha TaxID=192012 RepID=A0A5N6M576_9ASTR|nr:hypothetical protein E3N88_36897 [Mikania micrantha]
MFTEEEEVAAGRRPTCSCECDGLREATGATAIVPAATKKVAAAETIPAVANKKGVGGGDGCDGDRTCGGGEGGCGGDGKKVKEASGRRAYPALYRFESKKDCKVADRVRRIDGMFLFSWNWASGFDSSQARSDLGNCISAIKGGSYTTGADKWSWYGEANGQFSSRSIQVHDPWAFYLNAALLRQAFARCGKFPTAASRMSRSGPCLNPSVADHPLGSATDHRLGKLLPHQLANQTRTPPRADSSFC